MKTVDLSGRPFHFIGIGGIGMSALAYVLAKRQLPVSGSDLSASHITERLRLVGARIFTQQEASNLELFQTTNNFVSEPIAIGVGEEGGRANNHKTSHTNSLLAEADQKNNLPQVICSTAINENNSEYRAAIELGCPLFHRSDLLAALIAEYQSIAVSGTHGKTTTSSLIGYMLTVAGLDPTAIVGGEVSAWQGNARLGESKFLVAEADESDGSLVKHSPSIGIITNIELDHPDRYRSVEEVSAIFKIFATQCETLIGCIDDRIIKEELKPQITYSLDPTTGADYTVTNINYHSWGTTAVVIEKGKELGILQLRLLGAHNLSNALAAIAAGRKLGLDFPIIAKAMAEFEGAKRRFEYRGECDRIIFIDDYAHHPSEIRATLGAARLKVSREGQDSSRVVAIFQPHRYSRTQTFMQEFAHAFSDADVVVITDIYSAGETNPGHLNGQTLADEIAKHHPKVCYHPCLNDLDNFLKSEVLRSGDLALFLGAGNLNQLIPKTIALYETE